MRSTVERNGHTRDCNTASRALARAPKEAEEDNCHEEVKRTRRLLRRAEMECPECKPCGSAR